MANFNGEKYLEEALSSVLVQSLRPEEIIVVDDGSTDGSVAAMRAIASQAPVPLEILVLDANYGQGEALNQGLSVARGEFVALIDSDDIWDEHKLAKMSSLIDLYPKAAIYQHDLWIVGGSIWTRKAFKGALLAGDVGRYMASFNKLAWFAPTSGLVFPKKVLEEILPIPADFRISADGFLTRAAVHLGPTVVFPEPIGGYRIHNGNATQGNHHYSRRHHERRLRKFIRAHRDFNEQFREASVFQLAGLARSALSWVSRKIGLR